MRARRINWQQLERLRKLRRFQSVATIGLVGLGPVLVLLTFMVLGPLDQGGNAQSVRLVLLADLVYFLLVAALVAQRVARMIAARRAQSAGSRLHLRLTGVFAAIALVPTITVAIFASLTINVGLEGWFSDRVRQVVGSSLAAAQAYEDETRQDLMQDARALAAILDRAQSRPLRLGDGDLRVILTQGQAAIQRGLREAYIVDGTGEIRARGERSYLFDYERPSQFQFDFARENGLVVIEDWENSEFRVLIPLDNTLDRYLYVSRDVDGEILRLLDETQETVVLYQQLESERGRVLFEFGLLYLSFAVILIVGAIWVGLWFAERLSRPVGRLAGAAQRVGAGDLSVQVVEEEGDDEIAMLGRLFNQMTRQLNTQRETLLINTRQIERRRRLFDSVLSSVTAGVVGLDEDGKVTFVNTSAERLLVLGDEDEAAVPLARAVPEFGPILDRLMASDDEVTQEEIKLVRHGQQERLLVRIATRRNDAGFAEGFVLTFDDVTDLVAAQRMAAWGDVARRIAHEIKNPLTPIQLSAERIKRKFAGPDLESVTQLTDVIIRQTGDLRRIVDEFSKFARMPQPERKSADLAQLVRDAVTLQEAALSDVELSLQIDADCIIGDFDATMIGQAITNLIKNAGEAIESKIEKAPEDGFEGEVRVHLDASGQTATLSVSDNGIGLPQDRAQLFEPYVTTRSQGTGLGLPIVKKIIEEHGGTLSLDDAEVFPGNHHAGARATLRLPVTDITPKTAAQDRVAV